MKMKLIERQLGPEADLRREGFDAVAAPLIIAGIGLVVATILLAIGLLRPSCMQIDDESGAIGYDSASFGLLLSGFVFLGASAACVFYAGIKAYLNGVGYIRIPGQSK